MSSWYKTIKHAQATQQEIMRGYQNLQKELGSVAVTGNGANRSISVMGENLEIRPLLEQAISILRPTLTQKGVKEVNTDPLDPTAQGLAVSSEPGRIHVDVEKIVNNFNSSLPPTVEMDGIEPDPDIKKGIVEKITKQILSELGGTIGHESQHMEDYMGQYKNWQKDPRQSPGPRFNLVQEAPGPRFEAEIKEKFFQ